MSKSSKSSAFSTLANWAEALKALVTAGVIPTLAHRILLHGPAGTGKSAWAARCLGECERVTLHQQMPPDDLIGCMGLTANAAGGTMTEWQDGPAVRAMRHGLPLIIDEVDQFSPELRCALHAILDDPGHVALTLPTGEVVKPKEGFAVIGTTNASPASLPAPLQSRFDLIIAANSPAQGILDSLPSGFADLVSRSYERQTVANWQTPVTVRSVLAVKRIATALGLEDATRVVFGEAATDILASVAVQAS